MTFSIVVHECTDCFNIAFVRLKRHPSTLFIRLSTYSTQMLVGLPDFSTVVPSMPSVTHDIICISVPHKVVQKYGEDWAAWLLEDLNKTTQKRM